MQSERLEKLYARRTGAIKPGLQPTRILLNKMGNPQDSFASIHVAGTNGKGSVCAMLGAALASSGIPYGVYTSPHLVRLNERITINGSEVSDDELFDALEEVDSVAATLSTEFEHEPTFFECITVAAFLIFRKRGVKIAVLEVGMGGRLDTTNVVTPLVSVITGIAIDHAKYLGSTTAAIAGEKAGIIKSGRPVVIGAMPDDAARVMREKAKELGAPLFDAASDVSVRRISGNLDGQKIEVSTNSREYGTINTKLAAAYQLINIATFVETAETLSNIIRLPLSDDFIHRGIADAVWPGRFQLVCNNPPVLLDGAHNPDGISALVKALKAAKAPRHLFFVCGMCADKDYTAFFKTVAPIAKKMWTVPIPNDRSLLSGKAAETALSFGIDAQPEVELSLAVEKAKESALAENGAVIVCGSLFLVGQFLKEIQTN